MTQLALKNLSVDDARARMLADARRLDVETVTLEAALGRVLATAVAATRDQPPFAASAMDGWAIRRADLTPGAAFRVAGESAAGRADAGAGAAGDAGRLCTGAPVPAGADLVVIQEEAQRDGADVRFTAEAGSSSNLRAAGGDFRTGDALLAAG
ncbi:MAG: molybdopterin molybdenumtransferase MoeA, partial [bacterium]|nr:molybdopterin molybdenumtransferase MoeA [bacterium]